MSEVLRFKFREVDRERLEADVALAIFAAECVYGRPRVRMEASYLVGEDGGACVLEVGGEAGQSVARVFAGLCAARLGEELGLARDTTWHRVRRAIGLGYVVNQEARRGQPAKLVPNESPPEERPALPTPEKLGEHVCGVRQNFPSPVQPETEAQLCPKYAEPVESPVERAIQPGFQPPPSAKSDSEDRDQERPVERLNTIRGAIRTDAHPVRVYALSLAEELGFPGLPIRPGETVIAGWEAWRTFVGRSDHDRLSEVVHGLEEKSRPPRQPRGVL